MVLWYGFTHLLRLGAEYQVFRAGTLRGYLGAGLLRMASSWHADDFSYEDQREPREFWSGDFSHWALEGAPRLELFRENQEVDWTLSLAIPWYLAFATDLRKAGESLERRFREEYLDDARFGLRFGFGLAFGL